MKQYSIIFIAAIFMVFHSCSAPNQREDGTSQHIYIKGTKFFQGESEIYLTGVNTPWDSWNDFGGEYYKEFWSAEFKRLSENGINSSRIWFNCDGAGPIPIDVDGYIHKPAEKFWEDCDHVMSQAKENGIYVMATMMSFDHADTTKPNHRSWVKMFSNKDAIQSYCDNYLIPFVERYKDNPYLFSIDLCNEPEWLFENKTLMNVPKEQLQQFAAICAREIHKTTSSVLVSIGSACIKWNSDMFDGNMWSDENLQKCVDGDTLAYMDFWQVHYYEWINEWNGNPFEKSPGDYQINDRPTIIGETPGNNEIYGFKISNSEIYEKPYALGYVGVMLWTSNGAGVGNFGDFETFKDGAIAFKQKYPSLVR